MWASLISGGSRIFERGFQFQLDKNASSVWVEDQKKKVINLHTSLSAVFYIYYWMISNKTTVIQASQSDCSIRESRSDCSIRVYEFQKGFLWKPWNPPWIHHCWYHLACPNSQILYLIWWELLQAATWAREALKHSEMVRLLCKFHSCAHNPRQVIVV